MRRQLIDIGETVVNNAFGAAPEYGKSGARQRSFARPSASATRAATVVLRLRVPNDLPSPGLFMVFLRYAESRSMALTAPLIEAVCTNRGEPAIARENSRRTLVFGWPHAGAGP